MDIPLRFHPAEAFATLRAFLKDAAYSEAAVCRRMGVSSLAQLLTRKPRASPPAAGDALDLLISVFLLGEFGTRASAENLLPGEVRRAMQELGLLAQDGDSYFATVALYPLRNIYVVSDRWNAPHAKPFTPPPDIVYPAITPNTLRLLRYLPADPAPSLFEACSGAAAAALLAATRYAGRVWAADITARSTAFARFNCLLNQIDNVEVLQGDLYAPVRGMQFHRIIAHPPYLPAATPKFIFQDATEGGEAITRRLIEGLPDHLAPGGHFYCLTLGSDRPDETYEARIRRWLGARQSEFDLLLAVVERKSPSELAADFLLKGMIGHHEFVERQKAYEEAAAEFLYSFIVIQRASRPRSAFTVRRMMSPKTAAAQIGWLRRVFTAVAEQDPAVDPARMRPRAADPIEIDGCYRLSGGKLEVASFTIEVDYPLFGMLGVEPWVANLLASCDGRRTGRELYEHCRQENWISPEVQPQDFYPLLTALLTGGFVEVEGFSLPAAEE